MALGHRILVPLDGSELAERVLPIAAAIAKHAKGTLHLTRVHGPWLPMMDTPPSAAGIVAEAEAEARDASELYIEKRLESLRDAGVSATATMRLGAPDEEILRAAAEEGCDLVAMVTHGRGGFHRLWLGSVADRVVREADIPVLLLSAGGRREEERDDASLPPPPSDISTIIVPLDGSSSAAAALAPATALGDAFSADYILFRSIVSTGVAPYPPLEDAYAGLPEALEVERAAGKRAMEETAEKLRAAGYEVTVVVNEEEDPARAVLRLAERTPGSVIAMTTHGRGGLRRVILGSVADKVVRASPVPVLLVRPGRPDE